MIHSLIGTVGYISVNAAFVFALFSAFAYWQTTRIEDIQRKQQWNRFARGLFLVHAVAVVAIIGSLFTIIYNHYYEYHYAWSHSSNNLPTHFMISCFWEGQEGSFLLWIFWHVCLGLILIRTAKSWENNVMFVFALVQAFLVSMILGVVIGDVKIGSSPFILLRDAINAPIFQTNPDFVPKDGNGLNPLLQNYWMVIHPPTLFLGFAATLVPFAFCIAGLMSGKFKEWVKPALAWSHFAAMILGVGIMMGAYWAYETLNFGGYWNWDPVENAVYIPWLILVGSIHVMIIFRKNDTALKTAMILVITTFILILYATFLTRSGVLGEASVHSFTDLGLSGQLLVYLFAFIALSVFLLARVWNKIPTKEDDISVYSREFWIFMGATTLCLASFQVLVPTSIPVYNAFLGFFGVSSNVAPPAEQIEFYTKFQMWFGLAIAFLSGTGQFFFWKKMDKDKFQKAITTPIIVTLAATTLVIIFAKVQDWKYIVLLTTAMYSVVSNVSILIRLGAKNVKLSGGAVTHTGIALMLIGILFSSGYSNTISLNNTGRMWNADFPEEMNRENLLLFRNQPRQMKDYVLTYKGPRMESRSFPDYINKEELLPTSDPFRMVTRKDLVYNETTFAKRGDTIHVYNENVYYEIEYKKNNSDEVFTLFPRVQTNPQMGAVPSPDIATFLGSDLYTHITNLAVDDNETEWSEPEMYEVSIGDTLILHDYIAILENVVRTEDLVETELGENDFAVKANINVLGSVKNYTLQPIYLIRDQNYIGMIPVVNRDLGLRVKMEKIDPQNQKFTFSVATTQKDWIILKAEEKPLINILWIGTILMAIGFVIAIYRRFSEFMKVEKKEKVEKLKTPSNEGATV